MLIARGALSVYKMTYDDKPWLKSYDEGIHSEIEIPDITLVDRFDQILDRFPERPAIHFLGRSLNYRDLMGHANGVAHALMAAGCGPGIINQHVERALPPLGQSLDGRMPREVNQFVPHPAITGRSHDLLDHSFCFGFVPGGQHHFKIPVC